MLAIARLTSTKSDLVQGQRLKRINAQAIEVQCVKVRGHVFKV